MQIVMVDDGSTVAGPVCSNCDRQLLLPFGIVAEVERSMVRILPPTGTTLVSPRRRRLAPATPSSLLNTADTDVFDADCICHFKSFFGC
jgi:hypothetical protein